MEAVLTMRRIANALIVVTSMIGGLFVLYTDHISDWYTIGLALVGFLSWSIVMASESDE